MLNHCKLLIFLVVISLFICCNAPLEVLVNPTKNNKGIAALKITFSSSSIFHQISKIAMLSISAPDILTMNQTLTITDSTVEGVVNSVPVGKNRLFEIRVYDSLEILQYKGIAYAAIYADTVNNISISIVRVGGTATIGGNIVEASNLYKDTNTLALWNFNDLSGTTTLDESGNSNNGTLFGTTQWISATWGAGLALSSGSGILVKNAPSIQLSNFEIIAKVYPTSFSTFNNILAKEGGATTIGGYILRFDDYGYISGYIKETGDWTSVKTSSPVSVNSWYVIKLVKSSSYFALYVNDLMADSISVSINPTRLIGDLAIGYDVNLQSDRDFIGYIDAIKINRLP